MTCGEAIVKLLEQYGVDTIFGIPGVHNLELYRGLESSSIKHILTRHEQGAGFMADGYARASGKAGVCFVISGPGVTNIVTPMGQAYSDSVAMLVISSDAPSDTLGKGSGYLHEVTELTAVTKPLTAFSASATHPDELPELLARAFNIFASERPRPVHISVPLDVLALDVKANWLASSLKPKPVAEPRQVARAAQLLSEAERPLIIAGGGFERSAEASKLLSSLAETLGAVVVTTHNGKGSIANSHPLSLGATVSVAEIQAFITRADVVLALGTELADTDCYSGHYQFSGRLIHVDIDPEKPGDLFDTELAIFADARQFADELLSATQDKYVPLAEIKADVRGLKESALAKLTDAEKEHKAILAMLRNALAEDAFIAADMTQIAYSATSLLEINQPNCWYYPSGYGTLGFALPVAIGAKQASPERQGVVLIGDYGFQYTLQDLATATELRQGLAIVLWNNEGLGEIEHSMTQVQITPTQVKPFNPDFLALAKAYGCDAIRPCSQEEFEHSIETAFTKDRPTLIEVKQGSGWIQ